MKTEEDEMVLFADLVFRSSGFPIDFCVRPRQIQNLSGWWERGKLL
jgi:hypothetical protein